MNIDSPVPVRSDDLAEEFSIMRLLRRAWTPLPVSALALSSTRGASKRMAAAATMFTTPARTSAWISRGGWGGGRRDGNHGPLAARHLGREGGLSLSSSSEPLVQRISNELHSMKGDLEAHAIRGADSPMISKVLQLMDKLEPQDLGMKEGDFEGLECSLCIPVVIPDTSTNQEAFEITIFVIPEGGEIPLHDHPNMAVLTKILFGSLHVESYDLVGRSGDEAGEKEPTTLSRTTSAEAGARTASGGSGRRHEAVSSPPRSVGAETPSFLLTPSKGNVHAFKAPVTCAVLDILIPPYDIDRGRTCTFYRVETPDSPGNPELRSDTKEGAGDDQEEEESRRVVLQEISEPEDLPQWGEYNGPVVVLP
ncbi:unnamed protein product [Ascophyllum nodosum]